jgi:hypothetical protein
MTLPLRLLLPLVLSACASRSAPAEYPANAASSAQAPEAQLANVTLALSSEPPLPGEPDGAWSGLSEAGSQGGAQPTPVPGTTPPAGDQADPHAGHNSHEGHHHHGAH